MKYRARKEWNKLPKQFDNANNCDTLFVSYYLIAIVVIEIDHMLLPCGLPIDYRPIFGPSPHRQHINGLWNAKSEWWRVWLMVYRCGLG